MTHFPLSSHIQSVRARTEQSDAELLVLDDPDAFAELYDRHVGRILAWSSVRVGDYGADLTAEVFAAAWYSRKRFRDEHDGTALPWLYGIAHNVFRSSLRKRRVEYGARERLGLPITVVHADFEAVDDRLSFPSAVLREVTNLRTRARTARSALGRGTSLQGDRPAPPMHSRRSSPPRFSVAPSSPSGPRRVLT